MAKKPCNTSPAPSQSPLILLVSDCDIRGTDHWLARWEAKRDDCHFVDMGMWEKPHRNTWVNKLNLAIHQAGGPVILVAHGLGCVTVAWWAEYEQPLFGNPVVSALLVAPPDVSRPGRDPRLARFGAIPHARLPFPSFLAVSRNDPTCPSRAATLLGNAWDCRFADMGEIGHIDARSNLGDWPQGERLLTRLLREYDRATVARAGKRCRLSMPIRTVRLPRETAAAGHEWVI